MFSPDPLIRMIQVNWGGKRVILLQFVVSASSKDKTPDEFDLTITNWPKGFVDRDFNVMEGSHDIYSDEIKQEDRTPVTERVTDKMLAQLRMWTPRPPNSYLPIQTQGTSTELFYDTSGTTFSDPDQLREKFPGPYSDYTAGEEAGMGTWNRSPYVRDAMRKKGIKLEEINNQYSNRDRETVDNYIAAFKSVRNDLSTSRDFDDFRDRVDKLRRDVVQASSEIKRTYFRITGAVLAINFAKLKAAIISNLKENEDLPETYTLKANITLPDGTYSGVTSSGRGVRIGDKEKQYRDFKIQPKSETSTNAPLFGDKQGPGYVGNLWFDERLQIGAGPFDFEIDIKTASAAVSYKSSGRIYGILDKEGKLSRGRG